MIVSLTPEYITDYLTQCGMKITQVTICADIISIECEDVLDAYVKLACSVVNVPLLRKKYSISLDFKASRYDDIKLLNEAFNIIYIKIVCTKIQGKELFFILDALKSHVPKIVEISNMTDYPDMSIKFNTFICSVSSPFELSLLFHINAKQLRITVNTYKFPIAELGPMLKELNRCQKIVSLNIQSTLWVGLQSIDLTGFWDLKSLICTRPHIKYSSLLYLCRPSGKLTYVEYKVPESIKKKLNGVTFV